MPAPILSSLETYLQNELNVNVWGGEVPREDTGGDEINPPSNFPLLKISMAEGGFGREWTTEDPYSDEGTILVQIWDTTQASVDATLDEVETLLANSSNWANILSGSYAIYKLLLERWWSGQEENVRTRESDLLFRGDLNYTVGIHGAITTR